MKLNVGEVSMNNKHEQDVTGDVSVWFLNLQVVQEKKM